MVDLLLSIVGRGDYGFTEEPSIGERILFTCTPPETVQEEG
jgi:hypothetical protein